MSGWSEGFNAATMAKQSDSRSKLAWAELAAVEEEKLKRESDAGKAAEYFFKANPEAMAATGISEQQFANMSAREQSQAAMGFVQSQATKKIMQELADQKATQTANSAFGRDMSGVYGRNTMQTLAQGNGPVNPPAVGMDQLAAGLSPEGWQSPQAQTLLRELAQSQNGAGVQQDLGAIQYDPVPGMEGAMGWRRGNMAGIVQDPRVKAEAFGTARNEVSGNAKLQAVTRQLTELNRKYSLTPDDLKQRAKLMDQQEALMNGGEAAADQTPNTKAQTPTPADSDIAYLKAHPKMAGAFEKRFGAGSAAQYLK